MSIMHMRSKNNRTKSAPKNYHYNNYAPPHALRRARRTEARADPAANVLDASQRSKSSLTRLSAVSTAEQASSSASGSGFVSTTGLAWCASAGEILRGRTKLG